MNYIDTHCHLDFPEFHRDMEKTILRSFQAGLIYLINVGTDIRSSEISINLASRYHEIYAAVGVHPHEARKNLDNLSSRLLPFIKHPKAVAVGEIGLDYYRNLSTQDHQKAIFAEQLRLAKQYRKPVILHCRDAYRDLLQVLDREYLAGLDSDIPGVVHSFSAGPSYLQEFLRRGFYIGFNNMITYPDNVSLVESVKATPMDRIVLETDAPYLPPQSHRGERNEPQHVVEVAAKIAEIKQIDIEEVVNTSTANAIRLFGLK
ncbi:TPA: hydrolase TatD [Patescibacteria group bacterium]|uniref:Hydrolase, TatD family n=1 Tax=candidate division Kazan bacterium GW2011_GWB1_45_10 TaxID=1620411 RepID=A0A0G1KTC9_UNCK3|nr:MAG: Hydrolase, TatD family [candidate division Kazan bacterium GW2011_GWB1_45_10]HAR55139.1 hydrolase TatD [Patescibacteria group bacterium]HCR42165.1 hydrolase TatD [Patescibacteria group bacterium]